MDRRNSRRDEERTTIKILEETTREQLSTTCSTRTVAFDLLLYTNNVELLDLIFCYQKLFRSVSFHLYACGFCFFERILLVYYLLYPLLHLVERGEELSTL